MRKASRQRDREIVEKSGLGKTRSVTARGVVGSVRAKKKSATSPAARGGRKLANAKAPVMAKNRPKTPLPYRKMFRSSLGKRVDVVRIGVEAGVVRILAQDLQYEQGMLIDRLGFSRATISRKIKAGKRLDLSSSERVVGAMRLVGQVKHMVEESGDARGFDASAWVGRWLEQPLSALGGKAPAEFMNSATGLELVAQLLAQTQSGAYA
jgi:putative toxin-antitoxin system antitoxin component (TIGR02293 family)